PPPGSAAPCSRSPRWPASPPPLALPAAPCPSVTSTACFAPAACAATRAATRPPPSASTSAPSGWARPTAIPSPSPTHAPPAPALLAVTGRLAPKVMPPPGRGRRLSAAEVGLLREWIDQGLTWDDRLLPPPPPPAHWAFRPLTPPGIPVVPGAAHPIDAFL